MTFARTLIAAAATSAALVAVAGAAEADTTWTTSTAESTEVDASPSMDPEVYETRIRRAINERRVNHGLKRLRMESCTDSVAEEWSRYLAQNNAFYHQSMGELLERCNARYAGETLAMGVATPRQFVRSWMRSPGHRAILLSKSPRRIGIGAYPSNGQWVVAADFTRL